MGFQFFTTHFGSPRRYSCGLLGPFPQILGLNNKKNSNYIHLLLSCGGGEVESPIIHSRLAYSPNLHFSKKVGSPVAALLIWWTSERKVPVEREMGAVIVSIHFTHDLCCRSSSSKLVPCCCCSYFPLCSTRTQPMGEPPHTRYIVLL